jgi:hypothetical protein
MSDKPIDITVDAEKFDRILSNMLKAKPLSKAEVSERIKEKKAAGKEYSAKAHEKNKQYKNSKKLGQ